MSGNVIIRGATTGDALLITDFNCALALESEGLRLDPGTARRGVEQVVARPGLGRYFVAQQDGQVVGQLMITYEWSDWRAAAFWWIQSVYVRPDRRKQGIFRTLYRHVESLARHEPESCGLRLYVDRHNHRAMQAYEQLGLTPAEYVMYASEWNGPRDASKSDQDPGAP
jgi:GNAT superfamily N-acetyltransferase